MPQNGQQPPRGGNAVQRPRETARGPAQVARRQSREDKDVAAKRARAKERGGARDTGAETAE
jgi:hypothetical protein